MKLKSIHNKIRVFTLVSAITLLAAFLLPGTGFGQQASNIAITRTPYLSFYMLPDSFAFSSLTVPVVNTPVFSDPTIDLSVPASELPITRTLLVTDTRAKGGFNLQATATNFTGGTVPINNSSFRIVSTTSTNMSAGHSDVDNVIYINDFTGEHGITAPLDAGAAAHFGHADTFTSVPDNTLNNSVDILLGCVLPGPDPGPYLGRNGTVGLGLSYDLIIPKFQPPADYTSTVTYTITDASENCP
jgi:hypothetical protein